MDFHRIRAGNVEFKRTGTSGFIIGPQGHDGLDGVDMRLDQVAIPGRRGSFALPGDLASRAVSISGTCLAESPWHLRALGEAFTGLYADGQPGELIVDYSEPYTLMVQRTAKPQFRPFGLDGIAAKFQLNLWAPDPLMFGPTHTFGPVAQLVNVPVYQRGNADSPPTFTVTRTAGTVSAYAIYKGAVGQAGVPAYKVTVPVTTGHPHTIDMDTGDLMIDSVVVIGGRENATTWDINPGAPQTHFIDVSGGGSVTLTATVRDAIA